jgi:probable F420-dependent oxidoreductase
MAIKLDTHLENQASYKDVAAAARRAEEMGFAGLWSVETQHDPFVPLGIAAVATERIQLGTGIAIAFPRTPMSMAETAWDLAANSNGRFILGLGTQVKGHNERRFSVPWLPPGPRLRDYIRCLRAIWTYWQNGGRGRPNFTSDHYQFTLSSFNFNPPPLPNPYVDRYGELRGVPVYIAGLNAYMCRLAGELCEGLHVHPLHTYKTLTEFVLPNVEEGARRAGRTLADVERYGGPFVIMGDSEEERARARERVRRQVAFYCSTRTYRLVLEAHGWGEVNLKLNELSNRGEWDAMARLITDEMLEAFAVEGTAEEVAATIKKRYDGLLTRTGFRIPYEDGRDPERWRRIVRAFNGG